MDYSRDFLEAANGFEPLNGGFAVRFRPGTQRQRSSLDAFFISVFGHFWAPEVAHNTAPGSAVRAKSGKVRAKSALASGLVATDLRTREGRQKRRRARISSDISSASPRIDRAPCGPTAGAEARQGLLHRLRPIGHPQPDRLVGADHPALTKAVHHGLSADAAVARDRPHERRVIIGQSALASPPWRRYRAARMDCPRAYICRPK